MCIIAYKPAGIKLPTKKQFKAMFTNNSDGCGFMYAENGRVYIQKGFMEYNEFRKAVKPFIARHDLPMVFHFRIATHGGINKAMCQPFPLTKREKSLKALVTNCDIGIAHNGIIPMTMDARTMSDTALFIKKYGVRILENGIDETAIDIIDACIDSKMCILEGNGKAHIIGRGWSTINGISFSNDSYKPRAYKRVTYSGKSYATTRDSYTRVYDYDIEHDIFSGSYCDTSCDICAFRKYCFGTEKDINDELNARDYEI